MGEVLGPCLNNLTLENVYNRIRKEVYVKCQPFLFYLHHVFTPQTDLFFFCKRERDKHSQNCKLCCELCFIRYQSCVPDMLHAHGIGQNRIHLSCSDVALQHCRIASKVFGSVHTTVMFCS